ncbi:MAG: long-chain fatty acid--CoA ligase [Deltaproteobacteria bacterium]|nr:long-chain fatty acid--CoA ligase [Deltaproteobacteria bacterium]MBW2102529.1 long-chain fatty acid--CoA ligase [Deltaproteobacteria bacterium]MBW2348941.1 long-chain fatty acid--CoA ligase [Deltaproteobacteria bacterium]RLB33363.1 MAG: long-chain fatty acid--CoA ligase [Deltaproteobacteria bacterium]
MNLVELGEKNIQDRGERLALVFEDRRYTNVELHEMGRKLAGGLKSLGLGRGDHVAVSMSNCPEVWVCFHAIWRIGAVIVPVMFLLGEDETRYILDHADVKGVITSQDLVDKIEAASAGNEKIRHTVVLGAAEDSKHPDFHRLVAESAPEEEIADMDPHDTALMIYTSGTTGRPKGVMLTHNNLYTNAVAAWEANEWTKGPISVLCLPLAHSFGVVAMNAGNLCPYPDSFGVLMRWFDPEEIFRLIEKYRANNFIGVPTMYQVLLSHPAGDKYDTSSLERCTISAAPVTEELYRAFTEKFGCEMYEGYGLTEASPAVALCRPSMPLKTGSCGVPLPGVRVMIADENDQELPRREQGEILVQGPNVMKGYYKRPEDTAAALRGGWLHTGDVGYMDEEGYLYVTDRMKDMIIKGGYNIYPSEIEGYLEEHPAILEVSVIGIPDKKYGEEIMAFVVPKPGETLTEEAVIEFSRSRMTKFKCPVRVKFVEGLPKNLVGKVQKKELRKMA